MKEIKTIEIKCETKDTMKLEDMTVLQGNLKARTDDDYEKIKKSILKYGFSFPAFIWVEKKTNTNYLIDGTGRYSALKQMQEEGYLIPELPIVYIEAKDKAEAKNKLLRLNSQYGKMSKDSVLEFASDIELDFSEIALPDTTISFEDVQETQETEGDDDIPDIDEKEKPNSERGCLYELGNSILMCGDSTNAEDVARLMGGEKADLVLTDPPYGMKKEKEGVLNDNLNFDDLLEFNKKWIALSFEHLKDVGSWYCWGIDEPLMDIYSNILKPMAKENKITFRNLITWDKGSGQGENSEDYRMYAIADEKCLFVMKGVQEADGILDASEPLGIYLRYMTDELQRSGMTEKDLNEICGYKSIAQHWTLNRDGTQKQPRLIQKEDYQKIQKFCRDKGNNVFMKEYDEIKKEYDEIKKEWYKTRAYFNNTDEIKNNVWHFKRTSQEERQDTGGHATPKPIELCSRAINTSSRVGELVLDLFGGSGSTLIACEKNNRRARLMEIDPRYVDVIRKRWTKFAKENGLKIGSGGLE